MFRGNQGNYLLFLLAFNISCYQSFPELLISVGSVLSLVFVQRLQINFVDRLNSTGLLVVVLFLRFEATANLFIYLTISNLERQQIISNCRSGYLCLYLYLSRNPYKEHQVVTTGSGTVDGNRKGGLGNRNRTKQTIMYH